MKPIIHINSCPLCTDYPRQPNIGLFAFITGEDQVLVPGLCLTHLEEAEAARKGEPSLRFFAYIDHCKEKIEAASDLDLKRVVWVSKGFFG